MSVSASSAVSASDSLDRELASIRRIGRRNSLLKAMITAPFVWLGVVFAFVSMGLTDRWHSPLGDTGAEVLSSLLVLGQMIIGVDVALVGLYALFHLASNPRVSPLGKIAWFGAGWLTGVATLAYFFYEVFPENGIEDEPVVS